MTEKPFSLTDFRKQYCKKFKVYTKSNREYEYIGLMIKNLYKRYIELPLTLEQFFEYIK
jgi:hypothetical protein